jgi:Uma2 family endonuclease
MNTRAAPRSWSYEEFAQLPDDGNRYEIIAGELYVTPAPLTAHQVIVTRLTILVGSFVMQHDLGEVFVGPVDVLFGDRDYLEPDMVFVGRSRMELAKRRGIEGAPDLVVEVLSRSTAARDRGIKRERYALFGVSEYWVVDGNRKQVDVHRLAESPDELRTVTDTLVWRPTPGAPELEISLAALFRDLPR